MTGKKSALLFVGFLWSGAAQAAMDTTLNFENLNSQGNGNNTLLAGGVAIGSSVANAVASGDDLVYSVTYTGADFDGDGSNDTLSFDVRVAAVTGSTANHGITTTLTTVNDATATISGASAQTDPFLTLTGANISAWGVANRMVDGTTIIFTIENAVSSVGTVQFNGFNGFQYLPNPGQGYGHGFVVGSGTDLLGVTFNDVGNQGITTTETLYITADQKGGANTSPTEWGVGNVDFGMTVTVISEPGPEPVPKPTRRISFTGLNNADGLASNGITANGAGFIDHIVRTDEGNPFNFSVSYTDPFGTLTFDVWVAANTAGTITSGLTADSSGNSGAVTLGTTWGAITTVGGNAFGVGAGMPGGTTLRFVVKNLSYTGGSAVFNGFTGAMAQETTGHGHQAVVGVGSNLYARFWGDGSEQALTTGDATVLYISAAGTGSGWGVNSVGFDITTTVNAESDTYAMWAAGYDLGSGKNGDDDGDGLGNLLEFALGSNPTNGLDRSEDPTLTMTGNGLELSHAYRTNSSLTYTLESTEDLLNWTNQGAIATNQFVVAGDPLDRVVYTLPTTATKLFMRLAVESTNEVPVVHKVASKIDFQGELGDERYLITVGAWDLDRDVLSYAYEIVSGGGTLVGADGPSVFYEYDSPGNKTIRVTVSDGQGGVAQQDVVVTIPLLGDSYYMIQSEWETLVAGQVSPQYYAWFENNPDLPNVLLVGDSISLQYTLQTRALLAGEANVYRIPRNGGSSSTSVSMMRNWLSDVDWDVVHYNAGLHDLKYTLKGELTYPEDGGIRVTSPQKYMSNLDTVFNIIANSGQVGQLIWATTTPIPEGSEGRITGDSVVYNNLAATVLENHPDIMVNDLYTLMMNHPEGWNDANVHFNVTGQALQAAQVAASIRSALSAAP